MANALENGYCTVPFVLSPAECDALLRSFAGARAGRAGTRHLMTNSAVASLANDPRLVELAQRLTGLNAVPFRATLFEKTASSNWLIGWHQDTALPLSNRFDKEGWGPWSEKGGIAYAHAPASALSRIVAVRVHLDASGE